MLMMAVKGRTVHRSLLTNARLEREPGGHMTIAILFLCVIAGWAIGRAITRALPL